VGLGDTSSRRWMSCNRRRPSITSLIDRGRKTVGRLPRPKTRALVPHRRAWSPGPAELAAAGGADRRSAKNAAPPMNQSREAPYGAAAPLPRGPCKRTHTNRHQGVALKAPSELRDCHRQAQSRAQAADLHLCAPGRTRTCTLRIRSRPTTVHAVVRGGVVAAQVRWVVRLMRLCCAVWCLAE
jgi:hypothetical protein